MGRSLRATIVAALAIAAMLAIGWALLFVKPTLSIPRFLQNARLVNKSTKYSDQIRLVERGDSTQNIPVTLATERLTFELPSRFFLSLENAQEELTAARGWDLSGNPKDQVAQFYQRTTKTTVSLFTFNGKVHAVISQTRHSSAADRVRRIFAG